MAIYVLIHGGWHGAWCWDRVTPLLEAKGHKVYTPTLTGLGELAHLLTPEIGLDTHIEDVVRLLEKEDLRQVILVGHSYSGMVITGVADFVPERIGSLVYVDAFVPHDGESMADIVPFIVNLLRRDAKRNGDGWQVRPTPDMPPMLGGLFGITQEPDLSMVRSKVTKQSLKTFVQPLHFKNQEAASSIPRIFIQCTGGGPIYGLLRSTLMRRTLPPQGQGWRVRQLKSGHEAMILAPKELAQLLLEVA